MEQSQEFTYKYSAAQSKEVADIRQRYLPCEENKLQTLRRLDLQVQTAGMIPSLVIGVIGCLVFGIGMCFGLGVFAGGMLPALLLGTLGVLGMIPAYPVYKRVARKTREKLTPEILQLSEELLKP